MLRVSAGITALCALAAFILSLLCLLAGRKPGFLENAYLLNLNTSRIGYFKEITLPQTGGGGILGSIEGSLNSLLQSLEGDASEVGNDIAKAIGVHDWYSMHMLNFCEGFYNPSGIANNATKNITECSAPTTKFWFDPGTILQSELKDGITLDYIHWPSKIDTGLHELKEITHVSLGILFAGIALEGVLLLCSLLGIALGSRVLAIIISVTAILAFLFVGVTSGIATAVIVRAVADINYYGADTGVTASRGTKFLGMTWAAVALLLIAAIVSTAGCCTGLVRHKRRARKHEY